MSVESDINIVRPINKQPVFLSRGAKSAKKQMATVTQTLTLSESDNTVVTVTTPRVISSGDGCFVRTLLKSNKKVEKILYSTSVDVVNVKHVREILEEIKKIPEHENIVIIQSYKLEDKFCSLETDYFGSLKQWMMSKEFPINIRTSIACDVSKALKHLHNLGTIVLHGNLTPCNVILQHENGKINAKVTDYGLRKVYALTSPYRDKKQPFCPVIYEPPERCSENSINLMDWTPAMDVYQFGVLIYYLLTMKEPCDGEEINFKQEPNNWPNILISIGTRAVETNPEKRMNSTVIEEQLVSFCDQFRKDIDQDMRKMSSQFSNENPLLELFRDMNIQPRLETFNMSDMPGTQRTNSSNISEGGVGLQSLNPDRQTSVTNIVGSRNVQIGNNCTINTSKSATKKPKAQYKSSVPNTKEVQHKLCNNTQVVEVIHMLKIKNNINTNWKDLGRYLGIAESDIKCIEYDHHRDTSEAAYQMLYKWVTSLDEGEATLGKLASALNYCGRCDILELIQKIVDEN